MSNLVSVIIVSWNSARFMEILPCLHPGKSPASPFESRVVNNASSDDSPRMVREKFFQVDLIENLENVGFAPANNQVVQQCTGKYILLLNLDTLVAPGALLSLVDCLDKQPEVGAAGARILNPNGSLKISSHSQPTHTREFWRLLHLDWTISCPSRVMLVPFVIFEHSSLRQKHSTMVDRYWRLILALYRMWHGD